MTPRALAVRVARVLTRDERVVVALRGEGVPVRLCADLAGLTLAEAFLILQRVRRKCSAMERSE